MPRYLLPPLGVRPSVRCNMLVYRNLFFKKIQQISDSNKINGINYAKYKTRGMTPFVYFPQNTEI